MRVAGETGNGLLKTLIVSYLIIPFAARRLITKAPAAPGLFGTEYQSVSLVYVYHAVDCIGSSGYGIRYSSCYHGILRCC